MVEQSAAGPQLAAAEAQLHALLRSQANMLFQLIYLVLISAYLFPAAAIH